jgi:hypothetical protein
VPVAHTRRAVKPQPKPAKTPAWIQPHIQNVKDILRMRAYDMLGHLSFVQIDREGEKPKLIDFRKVGPAIAQAHGSQQIVIVSQWEGIPPRLEMSKDPCQSCLAKCEFCDGSGRKLCEAFFCGGSGTARMPNGDEKCSTCDGTGNMECSACRGLGKRPTGHEAGNYDWQSPRCKFCGGRQFVNQEIPVPLSDFECGRIGPMILLGPVLRFSVTPIAGPGRNAPVVYSVGLDGNNDGMLLAIESENVPCAAYLLGGIAKAGR